MTIPAKLEKRKSAKTGNDYYCIVVTISEGVEKLIFLDQAELKLIELTQSK